MRVGIVGVGTIFASHLEAWRAAGAQVVGVADVVRERADQAATQHSIPLAADDWRVLLDRSDIDLIDVCTPPKWHREPVIAALEAGKHVLCEKPLGPNLAEVDAILAANKQSKGKLSVCHQLRFDPVYQRMKWLVESGRLGRVGFARCQRYDAPPEHLVKQGVWGSWDAAGGGVLLTKAIHQLDLLLWLLGDVRRVQAMMSTSLFPIESEDQLIANIEFRNGAIASVCVSAYPYGFTDELDLVGDAGAVSSPWQLRLANAEMANQINSELERRFPVAHSNGNGFVRRKLKSLAVRAGLAAGDNSRPANHHAKLAREFVSAVEQGKQAPVSGDDGRKAVELCFAIYTSAITGRQVDLPLDSSATFYKGITKNDYANRN